MFPGSPHLCLSLLPGMNLIILSVHVGFITKSQGFSSFPSDWKCLLISWLQSQFAVILEPRKIKSATVSTVSPSISHEVMGPDAMILVF